MLPIPPDRDAPGELDLSVPPITAARAIAAASLPPSSIEARVQESRARQRRYRVTDFALLMVMIFLLIPVLALCPFLGGFPLFIKGLLLYFCVLASGIGLSRWMKKKWIQGALDLVGADDVRVIRPLIEIAFEAGTHERRAIRDDLIARLLRLRREDADLLDYDDRNMLRRLLKFPLRGENKAGYSLSIAILKAYEQMGNVHDLSIVQWLVSGAGLGPAPDRRVREAAQACLPILKERLEEAKDSRILLRAASRDQGASQALLRPGHSAADPDPAELLRANSEVNEERNRQEG